MKFFRGVNEASLTLYVYVIEKLPLNEAAVNSRMQIHSSFNKRGEAGLIGGGRRFPPVVLLVFCPFVIRRSLLQKRRSQVSKFCHC